MGFNLSTDIDSTCSEFDHGSALHIAASNLACEAVKVLLQNRANSALRDDVGRMPLGQYVNCGRLTCVGGGQ